MKECQICHSKQSFFNRIGLDYVTIGLAVDYGTYVLLCRACRDFYYDDSWDAIGNPYWKVIPVLDLKY